MNEDIKCPFCGRNVSVENRFCPHCGKELFVDIDTDDNTVYGYDQHTLDTAAHAYIPIAGLFLSFFPAIAGVFKGQTYILRHSWIAFLLHIWGTFFIASVSEGSDIEITSSGLLAIFIAYLLPCAIGYYAAKKGRRYPSIDEFFRFLKKKIKESH